MKHKPTVQYLPPGFTVSTGNITRAMTDRALSAKVFIAIIAIVAIIAMSSPSQGVETIEKTESEKKQLGTEISDFDLVLHKTMWSFKNSNMPMNDTA